jgi:hypothetical protein
VDISQEKEKAKYIHRLEVRRLILDKVLFGIVLIAIGLMANMFIEQYRSNLTEQRFFLVKKYQAVEEIRKAYGELFELTDSYTLDVTAYVLPEDYRSSFKQSIDNLTLIYNKWNMLLPKEFNDEINYHVWLYLGVFYKDIANFRKGKYGDITQHRLFLNDLHEQLIVACKDVLGVKEHTSQGVFTLKKISFEEASRLGGDTYYEF